MSRPLRPRSVASVHECRIESAPESSSQHADYVLLGPYEGIYAHPQGKGTKPCAGDRCKHAAHAKETQWQGYAPALVYVEGNVCKWVYCVLQITEALEVTLRGRELRGELWRLRRVQVGDGKARKVVGELVGSWLECDTPPEFDVRPIVHRVTHTALIQWDREPLFSQPVFLPPVSAPPPPGRRGNPIPAETKQPTAAEVLAMYTAQGLPISPALRRRVSEDTAGDQKTDGGG